MENVENVENVETEENESTKRAKLIQLDRQRIVESLDIYGVVDSLVSVIQRAEMLAVTNKTDYFVCVIEDGIVYMPEEQYNMHVDKTIENLREYLETLDDISEDDKNTYVDKYASDMVLYFVDHNKSNDLIEARIQQGELDE